jgi:CRISPR-associated protein Csx14
MAKASIPVDLFNPGQVFACMGLLEAADVLLGNAAGGFTWGEGEEAHFTLVADGVANPFEVILEFLANAEIKECSPHAYKPAPKKERKKRGELGSEPDQSDREDGAPTPVPEFLEAFPAASPDPLKLPLRLSSVAAPRCHDIFVSHWADGSSRNDFKLYAGNRSAASIARAMLRGTRKQPRGVAALWTERREDMIANPFQVLTPIGGSFNFDPRGAWTSIDAGYSPNDQDHAVEASPVVELLAAIGLEHSRPDEFEVRKVRYGIWEGLLPPILARPALAGVHVGVRIRCFQFTLDLAGKNKNVTFAREETNR